MQVLAILFWGDSPRSLLKKQAGRLNSPYPDTKLMTSSSGEPKYSECFYFKMPELNLSLKE